jgi:hypothetical protein
MARTHAAILSLVALAAMLPARAADPDRWQTPKPDKTDLSVAYIERTPRYPGLELKYRAIDWGPNGAKGDGLPAKITNAAAKHQPKAGDLVTFTAHVQNKGARATPRYDWHWVIDGKDVAGSWSPPLGVQQERAYKQTWRWQPGRHYVSFEVDRERLIDQITHKNDFVVDPTDALAFHFFVEKDVSDWFNSHMNGLDSYSWDDWAQFQVREMNREFRDEIHPATPAGVEIRARLDKVTVLPNGFADPGGTHAPIGNVSSGWDGVWGFTNGLMTPNKDGKNFYEANPQWLLGGEWPLHHELGHQFGQPDYYLLPVTAQNNRAVPGLEYKTPEWFQHQMMFSGNYYHDEMIGHGKGVWDSGYRFWGQHAAAAFNETKNLRRGFFGTFLVDVPASNTFQFVDEQMKPVAGAKVEVFPAVSRDYGNGWFPATPKFTGATNVNGRWTLDKSPYAVVLNWTSNGAIEFVITPPDGNKRAGFLNITDFNLAAWRGHTKAASYIVMTKAVGP